MTTITTRYASGELPRAGDRVRRVVDIPTLELDRQYAVETLNGEFLSITGRSRSPQWFALVARCENAFPRLALSE